MVINFDLIDEYSFMYGILAGVLIGLMIGIILLMILGHLLIRPDKSERREIRYEKHLRKYHKEMRVNHDQK